MRIIFVIATRACLRWSIGVIAVGSCHFHLAYAEELTSEEKAWLQKQDGKITLAPSDSYPPLDYYDAYGGHRGIAADYFRLIEQRLGFRFKRVRLGTWENILSEGSRGNFDVTTLAQRTSPREKFWNFSEPYIHVPAALIARKGTIEHLELASLSGKRVAVVEDYAVIETTLKDIPDVELVLVADDISGLLKVSFGEADVMVTELPVALYHIDKNGITNLRVAGETGFSYDYSIASRSDIPILGAILRKGLSQISQAERKRIERRWIHLDDWEHLQEQPFGWLGRFAALVSLLIIVLGVYAIRYYRLREAGQELQLKATREELESIFESSSSGMALLTTEGVLVRANPAFVSFLKSFPAVATLDAQLMKLPWFEKRFSERARNLGELTWRESFRFDGVERIYELALLLVPVLGQEKNILLRIDDITVPQFNLEQLEQKKKMASLSTLAAGVAHDFNNVLGVVSGNLTLIERGLKKQQSPPLQQVQQGLENLHYAANSARELTHKLMSLNVEGSLKKQTLNLGPFLEKLITVSRASLNSCVIMEVSLTPHILQVYADKIELERALLNIIINAQHSMTTMVTPGSQQGGVVSISLTKLASVEPAYAELISSNVDSYCMIRIKDTGIGMSEATRKLAFEPFFTTREGEGGTGLGLATSYRVIQEHGGLLIIDSALGAGTTVKVLLPLQE